MTLVRWDPFRDLLSFHDRFNRLFADGEQDELYGSWVPPVDIFERGDELVIRAEVPGVGKDDVDVRVEDGTLVLAGERKSDREVKDQNSYRRERTFGKFTRSFRLPTTVDASKVTAEYKDGVLEITLPKLEEAKPRKVEIKAA